MQYAYQYDVAAFLATATLLFVYFVRRSYINRSNRIFESIIFSNLIASGLNVVSCFTIYYASDVPLWLNYVVSLGYLFFFNLLSVLCFLYVDSKTKIPQLRKVNELFAILSVLFYFVTIVSSPWTHLVAYFDENRGYCHGPLMPWLFLIPFVAFMLEGGMLLAARKKMNKYQVIVSVFMVVSMSVSLLIQIVSKRLLICTFVISLILFFIYIALENSAHFTHKETQCFNRRAFLGAIEKLRKKKQTYSILALTLYDYEEFLHKYGSKTADYFSSMVAELFYLNFKKQAFALADQKFVLILKNEEDVNRIHQKMKDYLRQTIKVRGIEMQVSYQIVEIKNLDDRFTKEEVEQLVEYRILHPDDRTAPELILQSVIEVEHHHKRLLNVIRRAIEQDEIQVFFQPIYNSATGRFESAEALLRLYDKEMGFIDPETLVTIAEAHNYINQIGDLVFEKICMFLKEHDLSRLGVKYIEMNLSPVQCRGENLAKRFEQIMKNHGIRSDQINLEITETAQIENEKKMMINIQELNHLGFSFAIDDYGSGFASVQYLIKLPVSIVKIDKFILWNAMKNDNAMIVLKNMMNMLHELGKKIVVEGVEDEAMVKMLQDFGCDFMQGYYFSKPVAPNDYLAFLKEHN